MEIALITGLIIFFIMLAGFFSGSETAMTALAPAIANAVYNATGTRVYCSSLTPENILNELEKSKEEVSN